jgi:hypothetical protein
MDDLLIVLVALTPTFAWMTVNALKGKYWFAALGLFGWIIPLIGITAVVGAVRVAKPGSWWSDRYYSDQPAKRTKQRERFA